jgi:RNA recognition motif-containing protein
MSIYVGNLSYQVSEEDVTKVFSEYGTVKRVQLPTDRETGRMRGFGFVEMASDNEEAAAIEALDGAEWMGRDLKVSKAKPREQQQQRRSSSWSSSGNSGWGNSRSRSGDRQFRY